MAPSIPYSIQIFTSTLQILKEYMSFVQLESMESLADLKPSFPLPWREVNEAPGARSSPLSESFNANASTFTFTFLEISGAEEVKGLSKVHRKAFTTQLSILASSSLEVISSLLFLCSRAESAFIAKEQNEKDQNTLPPTPSLWLRDDVLEELVITIQRATLQSVLVLLREHPATGQNGSVRMKPNVDRARKREDTKALEVGTSESLLGTIVSDRRISTRLRYNILAVQPLSTSRSLLEGYRGHRWFMKALFRTHFAVKTREKNANFADSVPWEFTSLHSTNTSLPDFGFSSLPTMLDEMLFLLLDVLQRQAYAPPRCFCLGAGLSPLVLISIDRNGFQPVLSANSHVLAGVIECLSADLPQFSYFATTQNETKEPKHLMKGMFEALQSAFLLLSFALVTPQERNERKYPEAQFIAFTPLQVALSSRFLSAEPAEKKSTSFRFIPYELCATLSLYFSLTSAFLQSGCGGLLYSSLIRGVTAEAVAEGLATSSTPSSVKNFPLLFPFPRANALYSASMRLLDMMLRTELRDVHEALTEIAQHKLRWSEKEAAIGMFTWRLGQQRPRLWVFVRQFVPNIWRLASASALSGVLSMDRTRYLALEELNKGLGENPREEDAAAALLQLDAQLKKEAREAETRSEKALWKALSFLSHAVAVLTAVFVQLRTTIFPLSVRVMEQLLTLTDFIQTQGLDMLRKNPPWDAYLSQYSPHLAILLRQIAFTASSSYSPSYINSAFGAKGKRFVSQSIPPASRSSQISTLTDKKKSNETARHRAILSPTTATRDSLVPKSPSALVGESDSPIGTLPNTTKRSITVRGLQQYIQPDGTGTLSNILDEFVLPCITAGLSHSLAFYFASEIRSEHLALSLAVSTAADSGEKTSERNDWQSGRLWDFLWSQPYLQLGLSGKQPEAGEGRSEGLSEPCKHPQRTLLALFLDLLVDCSTQFEKSMTQSAIETEEHEAATTGDALQSTDHPQKSPRLPKDFLVAQVWRVWESNPSRDKSSMKEDDITKDDEVERKSGSQRGEKAEKRQGTEVNALISLAKRVFCLTKYPSCLLATLDLLFQYKQDYVAVLDSIETNMLRQSHAADPPSFQLPVREIGGVQIPNLSLDELRAELEVLLHRRERLLTQLTLCFQLLHKMISTPETVKCCELAGIWELLVELPAEFFSTEQAFWALHAIAELTFALVSLSLVESVGDIKSPFPASGSIVAPDIVAVQSAIQEKTAVSRPTGYIRSSAPVTSPISPHAIGLASRQHIDWVVTYCLLSLDTFLAVDFQNLRKQDVFGQLNVIITPLHTAGSSPRRKSSPSDNKNPSENVSRSVSPVLTAAFPPKSGDFEANSPYMEDIFEVEKEISQKKPTIPPQSQSLKSDEILSLYYEQYLTFARASMALRGISVVTKTLSTLIMNEATNFATFEERLESTAMSLAQAEQDGVSSKLRNFLQWSVASIVGTSSDTDASPFHSPSFRLRNVLVEAISSVVGLCVWTMSALYGVYEAIQGSTAPEMEELVQVPLNPTALVSTTDNAWNDRGESTESEETDGVGEYTMVSRRSVYFETLLNARTITLPRTLFLWAFQDTSILSEYIQSHLLSLLTAAARVRVSQLALENALSQAILDRFRESTNAGSGRRRDDNTSSLMPSSLSLSSLALASQFVSIFLRLLNFPLPHISLERSPFSANEQGEGEVEDQDYDALLVPYTLAERIIRVLISRIILLCSEHWPGRTNASSILSPAGTSREPLHWAAALVIWARILPSHWISSLSPTLNLEEGIDAALNRFHRSQRMDRSNEMSSDSALHSIVGLQIALLLLYAGFEQGDGSAVTATAAEAELIRLERGNEEEKDNSSTSSTSSLTELEPGESLLFRVATGGLEGPTEQHREARLRTIVATPPWYASVAVRTLRTVHEYLTKILLRVEKEEKWGAVAVSGPFGTTRATGLTVRQKSFLYDPTSEEEKSILDKLPVSLRETRRATKELRSRANIALLGKRQTDKNKLPIIGLLHCERIVTCIMTIISYILERDVFLRLMEQFVGEKSSLQARPWGLPRYELNVTNSVESTLRSPQLPVQSLLLYAMCSDVLSILDTNYKVWEYMKPTSNCDPSICVCAISSASLTLSMHQIKELENAIKTAQVELPSAGSGKTTKHIPAQSETILALGKPRKQKQVLDNSIIHNAFRRSVNNCFEPVPVEYTRRIQLLFEKLSYPAFDSDKRRLNNVESASNSNTENDDISSLQSQPFSVDEKNRSTQTPTNDTILSRLLNVPQTNHARLLSFHAAIQDAISSLGGTTALTEPHLRQPSSEDIWGIGESLYGVLESLDDDKEK